MARYARWVNVSEEAFDIYCGRGSVWGNQFHGHEYGRDMAIGLFAEYLISRPYLRRRARKELKGKVLGCHCKPLECHCELWCAIANGIW